MQPNELTDLIRRHSGLIHKIAYAYCRNPTDREDVVQEIAVQLWRSHGRYDGRSRETTWIYRIALNVAISFYRRERRHQDGREPVEEHAITIAAPGGEEVPEEVELLRLHIAGLGPLERALVLLHLDGNDHATIAGVLGISASNVGTRLNRIRTALRVALERRAPSTGTENRHADR